MLRDAGEGEEAERHARLSVAHLDKAFPPGHPARAIFIDALARVLTSNGKYGEVADAVTLRPLTVLARHAWADGSRLDLFAEAARSAEAIAAFAGPAEARGFARFCRHAEEIHHVVAGPFIDCARPTLPSLLGSLGLRGLRDVLTVDWHRSMWKALGEFFKDPRLRQLFGRYATYYGSDPFTAPATLNLIAHVEQAGVWTVEGGMIALARALERVAIGLGVEIRPPLWARCRAKYEHPR